MKVHEILNENEYDYDDFIKEIESIVGGKLSRKEARDAQHEWEQGGTSADDVGTWFQRDREDAAFDSTFNGQDEQQPPEYDIDPNDDFVDPRDEDQTDYSMRQGEIGFPDRQR